MHLADGQQERGDRRHDPQVGGGEGGPVGAAEHDGVEVQDVVPTVQEAVDGAAPADETLDGSSVLPLLAAGEAGDDR
ncbi:hypothetical protein [Streptomyces olivaceus]|uniref:hypothetical protein n=1 Tax=Streptomyces olivaceus TaxID=47716 RepID=UPI0033A33F2D